MLDFPMCKDIIKNPHRKIFLRMSAFGYPGVIGMGNQDLRYIRYANLVTGFV
jgi:hypothetical protein